MASFAIKTLNNINFIQKKYLMTHIIMSIALFLVNDSFLRLYLLVCLLFACQVGNAFVHENINNIVIKPSLRSWNG